jgi:hypothetical protein
MKDARQFFRRRVDVAGVVTVRGQQRACRIESLSLGGAYLAGESLTMGARVRLSLLLPDSDKALDLAATVSWTDNRGGGVHFDDLRTSSLWRLGRFLARA